MSIANWKASSRNNQQISYSDRPFESLLKSNEKMNLLFALNVENLTVKMHIHKTGEEETFNSLDAMS